MKQLFMLLFTGICAILMWAIWSLNSLQSQIQLIAKNSDNGVTNANDNTNENLQVSTISNSSGAPNFSNDLQNATIGTDLERTGIDNVLDTSIIILSSLIPTHPAIKMVNDTFNSISMLDGVDSRTPIFISVDGLPMTKLNEENIHMLHEYVKSLRIRFQDDPHVTIVNNYEHGHISNSIRVALELVKTEFIYIIQHDFKFIKHIDHTALVKSMREQPQKLQIVRFGKDKTTLRISEDCFEHRYLNVNGLNFVLGSWSDNNHFTTKAYYDELLANLGPASRPPEGPMQYSGHNDKTPNKDCTFLFQYLYNLQDGPFIEHLDGRLSTSYRRSH